MSKTTSAVWRRWLKLAEILGNVQMIVLLSLIYWTLLFMVAVPFKVLADPLALRGPASVHWVPRPPESNRLDSMKKQG